MKKFADLIRALDQTTSTNEKVQAMTDYFSTALEEDIIWVVALFTGKKPKRTVKVGELKQWAMELAALPQWIFEESYAVVGDLAETITHILPAPHDNHSVGLAETMAQLSSLTKFSDLDKKAWIQERWLHMPLDERFVFNKLITGGFRIGVSQQLLVKALALHIKLPQNTVAHRLMGEWSPTTHTLDVLLRAENKQDSLSRPYPFYLAYQLDIPLEELGDVSSWYIERKYDGIRGQVVVRENNLFVWSRGEELLTAKFPEFAKLQTLLPDGTVLDGEILPYKNDKPLPFQLMQTRIGRKNVSKKSLADAPLIIMAYDILEYKGQDMRTKPMEERRAILSSLHEIAPDIVKISPLIEASSWQEVADERANSTAHLCEGLMLKKKNSLYESGRKKGKWWKWKIDARTVDGVLLYAQRGHGRRADLYTDYTFAVWDGETLVPFTKAYSGLTDAEILEVDAYIKKNTIDKFGPVRSVVPSLVFEIAFEGINHSPRHKSGVALRFPRISRWRRDKTIEEANTKEDLLQLIPAVYDK